ncbi:hypothetical protein [Chitinophaga sp. YIM B06452]|uniref:hypothetical protein n=1 Tax=Chitinophaga sp. YIM B06452 TaxID=3082158 RepID=UPI0031FEBF84
MKLDKITIEIPAGKTPQEIEEIFKEILSMMKEDMEQIQAAIGKERMKNYRWPRDIKPAGSA